MPDQPRTKLEDLECSERVEEVLGNNVGFFGQAGEVDLGIPANQFLEIEDQSGDGMGRQGNAQLESPLHQGRSRRGRLLWSRWARGHVPRGTLATRRRCAATAPVRPGGEKWRQGLPPRSARLAREN